jgi:hypothetical protein
MNTVSELEESLAQVRNLISVLVFSHTDHFKRKLLVYIDSLLKK